MPSPRNRAAEELQGLELLFRYADHQDFQAERYAALIQRLDHRLRRLGWAGVATGLGFFAWAALHFIDYGQAGEPQTLALAIFMFLLAAGYVTYGVHVWGRYCTRIAVAQALLGVSDAVSPMDFATEESTA